MTWCTMSWKYSTVSKNNMTKLSVINCEGELEGNWVPTGCVGWFLCYLIIDPLRCMEMCILEHR